LEHEHRSFIAKTFAGLESVLAAELRALGAHAVREIKRGVSFEGDDRLLYRAHYELRTALRILIPIHSFPAYNEQGLYRGVREVDWSEFMRVSDTLAVDATVRSEVFRHSQYAALLTKDAIVDQFRDRTLQRPDVNTTAPTLRINLHIQGTHCDLSLDATDDSLHRRGYRRDTVDAPLNEVLAAGIILSAGWRGDTSFADPMCGSGTLPIEAAMVALNIPPQHKREVFGFFRWPDFQPKLWQSVKQAADARILQKFDFKILASDKDPRARNATALNVMSSGLEKFIQIEKMPFEKCVPPDPTGTLITNPPYDERLKVEDIAAFYRSIGDGFKQRWSGWDAWVFSSNREALKNIGLRASRKIPLFNGPLECRLVKFELYEGEKQENVTLLR